MADDTLTTPPPDHKPPVLDGRLVAWMAIQAQQDCYARLVDGGAEIDTRIELSALFIDLPVATACEPDDSPEPHEQSVMPLLFRGEQSVMPLLLGGETAAPCEEGSVALVRGKRRRWLLVGGPGSGKSTVTTMVAQQLRRPWIEQGAGTLPDKVREGWERVGASLSRLAEEANWPSTPSVLPLRVSLPWLARWMASRAKGISVSLWDYLAEQIGKDLASKGLSAELSSNELHSLVDGEASILWILDGLDEVPATAGRSAVIALVRASACDPTRSGDGMLVATRPQGYGGEFDDLEVVELLPLPPALALAYGKRLLNAWYPNSGAEIAELQGKIDIEFKKPDVAELVQTPLHTTMAALLLASRGSLPSARSQLFESYFEMIWKRELGKPLDHGIQDTDRGAILSLHTQAGITLHVRAQAQTGARASLRRRELRGMLKALYEQLGLRDDELRLQLERIMRFAADRLVLLLHSTEGEYEFGIRSLQEYFAALAVFDGDPKVVRHRLDVIALDPHWSNVLAFVASRCALSTTRGDRDRARLLTAQLCQSANDISVGGEAAARCAFGSRLAIAMLQETERYGLPWFHEPLWEVALTAASAPTQRMVGILGMTSATVRGTGAWNDRMEVHTRLGNLAAKWVGSEAERHRTDVLGMAETLLKRGGEERLRGWRVLQGLLLSEIPDAIRVANAHAPTTWEDAQKVLAVLNTDLDGWKGLPWASEFVEQHLSWVTPGWGPRKFGIAPHSLPSLYKSWNPPAVA